MWTTEKQRKFSSGGLSSSDFNGGVGADRGALAEFAGASTTQDNWCLGLEGGKVPQGPGPLWGGAQYGLLAAKSERWLINRLKKNWAERKGLGRGGGKKTWKDV